MLADHPEVAKPGDPDLDLDVDGTTLTSVVVMGVEVWLRFTGGFGWFTNARGGRWEAMPGDRRAASTVLEVCAGYPVGCQFFDAMVEQFERWRDEATPLRVCAAPGRAFTVIEDEVKWLPVPRRSPGRRS